MVGAGFSRNAIPIVPGAPLFPLWDELVAPLFDALHPAERDSAERGQAIKAAAANGGILRLAYEYETMYGRAALDSLIEAVVPDEAYSPGEVHRVLMGLPWADVFTTNYDTLLERARSLIHDRKYDVVVDPGNLPGAQQPRIVKLHGTLGMSRHFVITEEDYRTYPARFATFVNTVQQSLMENVLVLVGFSGDDPNFLRWIGWVRDNLGRACPPIYLCGLLELTASKRRLLESLNVVPIDVSSLFPIAGHRDREARHAAAARWLLYSLREGRPPEVLTWPQPGPRERVPQDLDAAVPSGPEPLEQEPAFPTSTAEVSGVARTSVDLDGLYRRWTRKRERYPGWVVLPRDNREALWHLTEHWIRPVLTGAPRLTPPNDLLLLRELVWRLERTLLPLGAEWAEAAEAALRRCNPLQGIVDMPDAPQVHESDGFGATHVRAAWMEVAFAIIRRAREDHEPGFHEWMERVYPAIRLHPEWTARWYFERCLHHLYRGEQSQVRATLRDWHAPAAHPFWDVRRGALLCELGEYTEAERTARDALDRIRSDQHALADDVGLLSAEGWAMMLISVLRQMLDPAADRGDLLSRWDTLALYRCDPRPELEALRLEMRAPPPHETWRPTHERTDPFTGEVHVTRRLGGVAYGARRPGFAVLRVYEDAGLPYRGGRLDVFTDSVLRAAKWVEPVAFPWATAVMVRVGDRDEIRQWFSRVLMAALTTDDVTAWFTSSCAALDQGVEFLTAHPHGPDSYSARQLTTHAEILARLTVRLSPARLDELLSRAVALYESPAIQLRHNLHAALGVLLRHTLGALPDGTLFNRLSQLLSLPVPDAERTSIRESNDWPEPFDFIEADRIRLGADADGTSDTGGTAEIGGRVTHLVTMATTGSARARRRALTRLAKLHWAGRLARAEQEEFGNALWARTDHRNLPSGTAFNDFAVLALPEPEPGRAEATLREHLLGAEFPRIAVRADVNGRTVVSYNVGDAHERLALQWIGSTLSVDHEPDPERGYLVWGVEDLMRLTAKALAWWNEERDLVTAPAAARHSFMPEEHAASAFSALVPILGKVILPGLTPNDTDAAESALRLLDELDVAGLIVLSALPETLRYRQTDAGRVARRLRHALASGEDALVRAAAEGAYRWALGAGRRRLPGLPETLVDELVTKMVARREPALLTTIDALAALVDQSPDAITTHQFRDMCIALESLILETQLPRDVDAWRLGQVVRTEDMERRPLRRMRAARLAYQLDQLRHSHAERHNIAAEYAVLDRWRTAVQNDVLPELHRIWTSD
jgi:hypothetical protein